MSKKTEGIGKFPAWARAAGGGGDVETLVDAYLESAESSDDQTRVVLLQGWQTGYRSPGLAALVDDGVNVERKFIRLRARGAWMCSGSRSASFRRRGNSSGRWESLPMLRFFVDPVLDKLAALRTSEDDVSHP